MGSSNSRVLRWTPRRSCFSVKAANQRSTRFSQEAPVGVKWSWKRGWRSSQRWISGVFMGRVIVDDQMEIQSGRHPVVDGLEKLAKLQRPMALMHFADYGPRFEIERREQVSGAVAQIVGGAPLGLARRIGNRGWLRSSA